jgi:spore maturation protein CgeB
MRILLVGHFLWPWYQEACAKALEELGHEVIRFGWSHYFKQPRFGKSEQEYRSFFHRFQARFYWGPTVWKVNNDLLEIAEQAQPEIVLFYNEQLIAPKTVEKLRKRLPHATFCQYANDNPFSEDAAWGLWRNFLRSIPLFEIHFAYRQSNINEYLEHGAKEVHLLRSYFIPEEDYPVSQEEIPERFKCDVVFAGHYENDGRVELLEAICDAGCSLNLFGGGWNLALADLRKDSPLRAKFPIFPVVGDDYRAAICGAKVALSPLSTLNQDTYTRRSFQIPAMQVAMLSQYTEDLAALYQPDEEAAFFRNKEELLSQLSRLISDEAWRNSVAEAGYKRVYEDGHDVVGRIRAWLSQVKIFQDRKKVNEGCSI